MRSVTVMVSRQVCQTKTIILELPGDEALTGEDIQKAQDQAIAQAESEGWEYFNTDEHVKTKPTASIEYDKQSE